MGKYVVAFVVQIPVEIDSLVQGEDSPEAAHRFAQDFVREGLSAVKQERKNFLGINNYSFRGPAVNLNEPLPQGDVDHVEIIESGEEWDSITKTHLWRSPFLLKHDRSG